jgi:hypothetical protein
VRSGCVLRRGGMGIGVNNAGFGGIAAYLHVYSNLAQPAAIFENGAVGIGTNAPAFGSTLHIYDARTAAGTGATKVIIQAGANQSGVNLLEWQDAVGTVLGRIDGAGNLFVNTNTTLGDAAGDVVVFNARVGSHVVPSANNAYDLGENTTPLRWRNVYGVNGNFSTLTVSGLTQGSVIFAGTGGALSEDNSHFFWDDANNRLGIGTSLPSATLHVAGTAQVDGNTTLGDNAAVDRVTLNARVQSDVVPSADNTYDLGEDATPLRWRSGYFGTQVKVGTSVSLVAGAPGTPDRLQYSGDGIVRTAGTWRWRPAVRSGCG